MDSEYNNYPHDTSDEETLYVCLVHNLDQEILIQRSFLRVLDEELSVLISASMDGMEETNSQKELLIYKTKENTFSRQAILDQVKKALGLQKDQQITLSLCESRVSDEILSGKLRDCRQILINLMEQVQKNNQRNQDAIRAALENVHGSLQFLKAMLFPAANYQKTGQYNQNNAQGAFISQEG
ncbi:MAG: flagellar protein FlgN [Syntrophobacterales bacterium]|jgi:flagellar biosynthesis/type III secretory pathway chaperone|nr:flagellar protein FlgN [Syntrophobacterales bacterium]